VRLGSETIVVLSGELDVATAPILREALAPIEFPAVGSVVLDLDELSFIDARGLREILALHATCMSHSAALVIRPGPRAVQRVFEVTGTDRFLPFTPSGRSARRSAPGARPRR
jgi:anti-sigma B factor antagonist